jgi:hypothetical protein
VFDAIPFKPILHWLVLLVLAICVIESYTAAICRFLPASPRGGRFVWAPDLDKVRNNWFAFSAIADEEIGGLSIYSPESGAARDPTGAKKNPRYPQSERACGSAYGESLVLGYEVEGSLGWVEQLSKLLGCRVANYAVNSNSTDQSYLRFISRTDKTSFVLLGIDPSSIVDNISQYSGFLRPPLTPYGLKGRFVLDPFNRLKWLSRPRVDESGFTALHRNPEEFLPNDYFLPDTADGPVTPRFPYGLTLLRIASLARVRGILAGRTEWGQFFAYNHPSGALPLLVTICKAFVNQARYQGERALVVILPVAKSFHERISFGKFEYDPLLIKLIDGDIEVFDAGTALFNALGDQSYCKLFIRSDACEGHYSVLGNTLLAGLVADELRRRGFVTK